MAKIASREDGKDRAVSAGFSYLLFFYLSVAFHLFFVKNLLMAPLPLTLLTCTRVITPKNSSTIIKPIPERMAPKTF